ncbi:MAG: hypothetical protein ACOVO1_09785 [Chitinophagaceae bacterium]
MQDTLQKLTSDKINAAKWDACVIKHQAPIYASFNYLNTMADNWMALILNDYEAIFPICYRKKLGITYSYTPAFIQQLGCIGKQVKGDLIEKKVFEILGYGDLMLNSLNERLLNNITQKTNLIINLNLSYESIYSNYKKDLKQNLKKAASEKFLYKKSDDIDGAINMYQIFYANRMQKIKQQDFDNFKKVCWMFQQKNDCLIRQVWNTNNEILAVALLLKHNGRIYNLANSTSTLGRKSEANHFLLDRVINEFSSQNLFFDFEGSDLPGVKTFYEKFGATNEPYFYWHFNNLPWWIKWAKK